MRDAIVRVQGGVAFLCIALCGLPWSPAALAATAPEVEALVEFPHSRLLVIVALIVLMALLFAFIFYWQQRIEQAAYFAHIYQETIEDIETKRHIVPIEENWRQGSYVNEILLEGSDRGVEWLGRNPRPVPGAELDKLAAELGQDRPARVREVQLAMASRALALPISEGRSKSPFGSGWGAVSHRPGGSLPGLGGSWPANAPEAEARSEEAIRTRQAQMDRFEDLLGRFQKESDAWLARAWAHAEAWYQLDVDAVKKASSEQAHRALGVDFSALRGRGPEFVLEFTTIVIIVFAAVILGVVKILGEQQIGTLLAAIAGYVLGKGASRTTAGGEAAKDRAASPARTAAAPAAAQHQRGGH